MFAHLGQTLTSTSRILWIVALLSILTLAACASPAPSPAVVESDGMEESEMAADAEEMPEEATESETDGETVDEVDHMDDSAMSETQAMTETMEVEDEVDSEMADEEMADETMAAVDLPSWQQLALTDARTGESFTFADFNGKTVFVEPMATWCGNCRRQLTNVQEASAQLGDDVVFVALSVETNIADEDLAAYAANEGFEYTFAVMTPQMLSELAGAFGQTISNPPATPHFIILPDGSTTDLVTGIEPAAELIAQLEAARS